ncbi:retron St85 family RNA-directed DNA polymerase [Paraburkholderia caffeinilytica]|uniref:retron St85 family RNA-directed DNA polymerase n=1 Tax=Paraburkholderia caffeinilytica TaxID=1761016 RepID=UPI003DA14246
MILENELLFQRILATSPFSARELTVLISTASERYKDHYIEKRHGRGLRLISQPTAELKYLQRKLIQTELADLPCHDAALAYRKGISIKDHAAPHATGRYLLKLDFRDFFPSLKESALRYRLQRDKDFSSGELWMICQLLCRRDKNTGQLQLSIGAPSSPFISNYLLWEFDTALERFCAEVGARYTRYADDLAFSTNTPHVLDLIASRVQEVLNELSYLGLTLNASKTVNVSTKSRRVLVGLVLSNSGVASIGREEKRKLRAMMHALSQGKLLPEEVGQLRGKLAFVQSIDTEFVSTLCTRYGFSKVSDIQAPKQNM